MHIPENYLSPSICAVMTAAMLPVWGYSIHKIKTGERPDTPEEVETYRYLCPSRRTVGIHRSRWKWFLWFHAKAKYSPFIVSLVSDSLVELLPSE